MKRKTLIGPIFLMILSAASVGSGFQLMLIPQKLLSSGISGVAMVVGYMSGWNIGWLYFALNVPILLWGYRILGKRFIPVVDVTEDRLLASVFGGILVGIGSSIRRLFRRLRHHRFHYITISGPPHRHPNRRAQYRSSRFTRIAEGRLERCSLFYAVDLLNGKFTSEERDMLMTVTTRYELAEIRNVISEVDSRAFVNVVQTIDVIGEFRR
jgi:uncharacterized membrane-anchored protein YitT (DUF2179 family)